MLVLGDFQEYYKVNSQLEKKAFDKRFSSSRHMHGS